MQPCGHQICNGCLKGFFKEEASKHIQISPKVLEFSSKLQYSLSLYEARYNHAKTHKKKKKRKRGKNSQAQGKRGKKRKRSDGNDDEDDLGIDDEPDFEEALRAIVGSSGQTTSLLKRKDFDNVGDGKKPCPFCMQLVLACVPVKLS
jgi:hypothetical protein